MHHARARQVPSIAFFIPNKTAFPVVVLALPTQPVEARGCLLPGNRCLANGALRINGQPRQWGSERLIWLDFDRVEQEWLTNALAAAPDVLPSFRGAAA